MPLTVAPARIELSDFIEGWTPDAEPAQVEPNALLQARNLLPDPVTGAVELRKGFKRITASLGTGYTIQSIHPYNRLAGDTTGNYLIVVSTTTEDSVPGNVAVHAVNLATGTATLISPNDEAATPLPTQAWASGNGRHWGETIQETFYGGGPGDPMYAWNPDDGWDGEVSTPDEKQLVDSVTPTVATQVASDYAFKVGDRVLYPDPTGTPTQPTVSLLTASGDDTNDDSYTTASISPGNNKLVLVAVLTTDSAVPRKPKVSGCGLTFVEVKDVKFDSIASPTKRLTVFRAMKAAPTTGALTIAYGANQTSCTWSVLEVDAMNTGGNNGSGAVQTAKVKSNRTDSGTSLSVTMDTMLATSTTVGFFARDVNDAMTPGTGFTELSDTGHAQPARLQAEALAGQDTSVDSSFSSSAAAGVGIEVLAGGTGGLLLFEVAAVGANKDIRYKTWRTGTKYERGRDYVSRNASPAGESTYWRSYRCIKTHTSDATNRPGDGSGAPTTYWRQVTLPLPMDTDGTVDKAWNLIPTASETNVAAWHAERLFMRYDTVEEQMGLSRTIFSPPSKKNIVSGDFRSLQWDPKNFGQGPTKQGGDGGGDFDTRTGDGDPITGYRSYGGTQLFVFKRHSTHVLVGRGKPFSLRELAKVGCVSHRAHAELNEVVYFLGDRGLYRTDGTAVVPVDGFEKTQEWFRNAVDWSDDNIDVTMWAYNNLLWISVPTTSGRNPDQVIVYDPVHGSFWPLDLEVAAVAVNRKDGVDQMFFAPTTKVGTYSGAAMAWTGTNHESTSTRTISAVVETNLLTDPSFEPKRITPFVSALSSFDWQTLAEVNDKTTWLETKPSAVTRKRTTQAALRGKTGMQISNTQDPYFFDDIPNRARPPLIENTFEGIYENIADVDTSSHNMSVFIRRLNWRKNRKIDYTVARIRIGTSDLASGDHTYTYIGRGWYRMSASYTGVASARPHGIVVKPQATVQLDKAMVVDGALVPYFDGDGSDGGTTLFTVTGGEAAFVMQYDHDDVKSAPFDDKGEATYENEAIGWGMQTAWLPFGVARQERRIRRVWALVRGVVNIVLQQYRNYDDSTVVHSSEILPTDENAPVSYFEGRTMEASHSISLTVEGLGGPVSVLGLAVDTEHVRTRFGRG